LQTTHQPVTNASPRPAIRHGIAPGQRQREIARVWDQSRRLGGWRSRSSGRGVWLSAGRGCTGLVAAVQRRISSFWGRRATETMSTPPSPTKSSCSRGRRATPRKRRGCRARSRALPRNLASLEASVDLALSAIQWPVVQAGPRLTSARLVVSAVSPRTPTMRRARRGRIHPRLAFNFGVENQQHRDESAGKPARVGVGPRTRQ